METVRVNICYRPLRICWAIAEGDFGAFRRAVRLNHTMWGGRFNPIAIVDREEEARRVVEVFRADVIIPFGDSPLVAAFPGKFQHLINPLFPKALFLSDRDSDARAHLLDIHNALIQLRDTSAWKALTDKGIRVFEWDADDPLADLFLTILGAYPDKDDAPIDYRAILNDAANAATQKLDRSAVIPADIFQHPSIGYLSRHGLWRHHGVRSNWDYPGFYLGDVLNLHDLVTYWNLRATDTSLLFVDAAHLPRYDAVIPDWTQGTNNILAGRRFEFQRKLAIWRRRETIPADHNADLAQLRPIFGEGPYALCPVDIFSWNGLNLQAPMMILGDCSQMGILDTGADRPRLSFAYGEKPFVADTWFHTQHLVASLSFIGGLYSDDLHTLDPPYVPELNEFLAREMGAQYDSLRVEPDRVGLVINATEVNDSLNALPAASLFERIFKLAGYGAKPSSGGLITRQLITQLDRLRGASVFKIPGVRRLIKKYGPAQPFPKRAALQEIGRSVQGETNFDQFKQLYIEQRERGTDLTPDSVFNFLVAKGLYRIGAELKCPHCRMDSWVSIDALKQRLECDLCGRAFDATKQLLAGEYMFRRSGVMGAEKNVMGAIPVALTLQQLDNNFHGSLSEQLYSTSLELTGAGATVPVCELDFIWMRSGRFPGKIEIIIGECKDRGRNVNGPRRGETITQEDVDRLRAVADALPNERFEAYILLAKLNPFTPEEIATARTLNGPSQHRVILLTADELEPWHMYDRLREDLKKNAHGGSAENLAIVTEAMYFSNTPPAPQLPAT